MTRYLNPTLFLLVIAAIAAPARGDETARYRLTFDSIWSAQTHPTDFPSGSPHFSGLVGGTHNSDITFWEVGGQATSGIERMAELGSQSGVITEVSAAISNGTAGAVIAGPGIGRSPGSAAVEFDITRDFPLVTVTSMIAPSPDWFVGVSGLSLLDGGDWVGKVIHDLPPYDAGTDSGVTFTSADADTQPFEPIHSLSSIFPFQDTGPLGTFTILRLLDGDFDESGTVDAADIDLISDAIRTNSGDAMFDLTGDNIVSSADRDFLVHDVLKTYYGDSNLDGEVNSSDLTLVFQHAQYEDGIEGNSTWATGDWNGDREFSSGDLVFSFQEGAYEQGPQPLAAVPEPSGLILLAIGILFIRRKATWPTATASVLANPQG